MKLSKNFTLREMTRSQTATRYNIDNIPNNEQIDNLIYLCENGLQKLRDYMMKPVKISSGFRSVELNKKIGGSDNSLHCYGCAVDIDNYNLLGILKYIHDNLDFTELIAEYFPGGWIHYGLIKGRENDKVLKLKDMNNNYRRVSIEYIMSVYGE